MKKWIVVACTLFLLFLVAVFFLIPRNLFVNRSISTKASYKGITRFIQADSNWNRWQHESFGGNGKKFKLGGFTFNKTNSLFSSAEFNIENNGQIWTGALHILPDGEDSVQILWEASTETGNNPLRKIRRYIQTRALGREIDIMLSSFKDFVSNVRNLYSIDIKEEKVKIEYLVSAKKVFDHYPQTGEIYKLIGELRAYVALKNGKEEDFPMLHFWDSTTKPVAVQVAIPVNTKLPETAQFISKRMLKNGNILVAEVKGGLATVDFAMKQVEQYLTDHHYSNVAIPFQSLVTDRIKQPDSSNWITRVYYPIR